jgi:SAM-dependent methyltransferase
LGVFEILVEKTKRRFPGYRFSWEIFTGIILKNIADKPFWLDIGAGPNILIKEQPGAAFSVGLDIIKDTDIYIDHNTGAYVIADSRNLPFKNDSFGFVTARYIFEHLQNPENTLEEIHRILKPAGIFAMQTTNKKSPLILIARLVPFKLKRALIKNIFRNAPSDTFKTYYEINTPQAIKSKPGSLRLHDLIMVEDPLCQSKLLYSISMLIFRFIDIFQLNSLKNNIISIYKKPGK